MSPKKKTQRLKREVKPKKTKRVRKKQKKNSLRVVGQIVSFPAKLLEPIAHALRREVKRLEKRRKQLTKSDPFSEPARLDDNASSDSDAAEQAGHERVTAMRSQTERRLVQIKKALTRIKIGKYAICEKCGGMIDTDRLVIMPEATCCVQCSKKK